MNDPFARFSDGSDMPSLKPFTIVPDDEQGLPMVPKALFIGGSGDICLRGWGTDTDVTFRNVAEGQILPVRPSHIRASGTTASDIVGLG